MSGEKIQSKCACGEMITASADLRGQQVACPGCGQGVILPGDPSNAPSVLSYQSSNSSYANASPSLRLRVLDIALAVSALRMVILIWMFTRDIASGRFSIALSSWLVADFILASLLLIGTAAAFTERKWAITLLNRSILADLATAPIPIVAAIIATCIQPNETALYYLFVYFAYAIVRGIIDVALLFAVKT